MKIITVFISLNLHFEISWILKPEILEDCDKKKSQINL